VLYFEFLLLNFEILYGLIIDNIFENPAPTFAILSFGSLNGILFHTLNAAIYPCKLTKSFSHDAHDQPYSGFLASKAV